MNRISRILTPVILTSLLLFSACGETSTQAESLTSIADQADQAEVILQSVTQMSGEGTSTDLVGTTSDPAEIKRLVAGINGGTAPEYKCGYDGKILLKKGGEVLLNIDYNLDPDCQHAAYIIGEEMKFTLFTEDGISLLEELLMRGS